MACSKLDEQLAVGAPELDPDAPGLDPDAPELDPDAPELGLGAPELKLNPPFIFSILDDRKMTLPKSEKNFLTSLYILSKKEACKISAVLHGNRYVLRLLPNGHEDSLFAARIKDFLHPFFTPEPKPPKNPTKNVEQEEKRYKEALRNYHALIAKRKGTKDLYSLIYQWILENLPDLQMNEALGVNVLTRGMLPYFFKSADGGYDFRLISGVPKASDMGDVDYLTGEYAAFMSYWIALFSSTDAKTRMSASSNAIDIWHRHNPTKRLDALGEKNTLEGSKRLAMKMWSFLRTVFNYLMVTVTIKENGQFFRLIIDQFFEAIGTKNTISVQLLREMLESQTPPLPQSGPESHHGDKHYDSLRKAIWEHKEFFRALLDLMTERGWVSVFMEDLLIPHFALTEGAPGRIFDATDKFGNKIGTNEVIKAVAPICGGKGKDYLPQFPKYLAEILGLKCTYGALRLHNPESLFKLLSILDNAPGLLLEGFMMLLSEVPKGSPNLPGKDIEHLHDDKLTPEICGQKSLGVVKLKAGKKETGYAETKKARMNEEQSKTLKWLVQYIGTSPPLAESAAATLPTPPSQLTESAVATPPSHLAESAAAIPPPPPAKVIPNQKIKHLTKKIRAQIAHIILYLLEIKGCAPTTWCVVYTLMAPRIIEEYNKTPEGTAFLQFVEECAANITTVEKSGLTIPGLRTSFDLLVPVGDAANNPTEAPKEEKKPKKEKKAPKENPPTLGEFKPTFTKETEEFLTHHLSGTFSEPKLTELKNKFLRQIGEQRPQLKPEERGILPEPVGILSGESIEQAVEKMKAHLEKFFKSFNLLVNAYKTGKAEVLTTAFFSMIEKEHQKMLDDMFAKVIELDRDHGLLHPTFETPAVKELIAEFLKDCASAKVDGEPFPASIAAAAAPADESKGDDESPPAVLLDTTVLSSTSTASASAD